MKLLKLFITTTLLTNVIGACKQKENNTNQAKTEQTNSTSTRQYKDEKKLKEVCLNETITKTGTLWEDCVSKWPKEAKNKKSK